MQDNDVRWFLNNYDSLYKKYGKCFLVIKNESILGKYKSPVVAINKTMKTEEGGTFVVMECKSKTPPQVKHVALNKVIVG